MNEFDRLLASGVGGLRARLASEGLAHEVAAAVGDAVAGLGFPGLFAFLAGGGAEEADEEAGRLLREAPRRALAQAVGTWAGDAGLAVSPEEAAWIAELLASGEFFGDVADATAVILRVVHVLPGALVEDVRLWQGTFRIPRAVARDLRTGPVGALLVARDLLDGDLAHTPQVLRHTLRALYELATLEKIVRALSTLIAPENRSVRLAIVIYARANGVGLRPEDLDVLRESVLDVRDPDLGPALVAAWERFGERTNAAGVRSVLARLADPSPPKSAR